jgi:methionine-S-sulfoxide reductase
LNSTTTPPGKAIATLAGGCFWCLEAVYDGMKGVSSVESGYMGGQGANPTYEQVCRGDTGYAEVVRVTFDPATVSFKELLGPDADRRQLQGAQQRFPPAGAFGLRQHRACAALRGRDAQ